MLKQHFQDLQRYILYLLCTEHEWVRSSVIYFYFSGFQPFFIVYVLQFRVFIFILVGLLSRPDS